MGKRTWVRPELVILAKSTPGEDILTVCKSVNHATAFISGTDGTGQMCKVVQGVCGACQSEGGRGS